MNKALTLKAWMASVLLTGCLIHSPFALAKRLPPKPVDCVTVKSTRYCAPHFAHDKNQQGGFIVAFNKHGRRLWKKKIYTVSYDDQLERDVQHVYITDISVEGHWLHIINEKAQQYWFNLKTKTTVPN